MSGGNVMNIRRHVIRPGPLVLALGITMGGCKPGPITISQGHIEAIFSAGTLVRVLEDTSGSINVGRTGGPNVYDFRNLAFFLAGEDSVFSVTDIPQLAPRYPSHAVALREGRDYPVFTFSNQAFASEGRARITSTAEWYQHKIPAADYLRFPVRINSQFSTTNIVVDTTYVGGTPTTTSSNTDSTTAYVDAYGKLLLPDGLTLEALRLRTVGPGDYKSFQFWTREGVVVNVTSHSSQPDTGVVRSGYVLYVSSRPRN